MDSKIRHGNVCVPFQLDSEVITPGVDVVGTVSKCGDGKSNVLRVEWNGMEWNGMEWNGVVHAPT